MLQLHAATAHCRTHIDVVHGAPECRLPTTPQPNLQVSNAAYQSKLGCRPGGKDAMAAIGFK